MSYNNHIITTFQTIKLNHKESVMKSKSRKREKHVKEIIKQRKIWKETKTIHIINGNTHKLYR